MSVLSKSSMKEENNFKKINNNNYILNKKETDEKKIRLKSMPIRLVIVLTTRCIFDCIMCKRDKIGKTIEMKYLEKIKELLPFLRQISWQGGEVFLCDYFKNIFEYISKNYSFITQDIITSGVHIDSEWAELIVNSRVNLCISVDSADKETYEYIRKGTNYNDLIKAIELLFNAERKYKFIDKQLNVVLMRSNYKKLNELLDFAYKYHFEKINITPIYDKGIDEDIFKQKDNNEICELKNIMNEFKNNAKLRKIEVFDHISYVCDQILNINKSNMNSKITNHSSLDCLHPWKELFIDVSREGNIYPDCFCNKNIGNIYNDNLIEIWNNKVMQEYRKRIKYGNRKDWCQKECLEGFSNPYLQFNYNYL